MHVHTTQTDIAVIGAGPVGLFAVFACGMLGLRCAVIDALPAIGGQCAALYPEKPIYDIPGYPRIAAGDLIDHLAVQAAPFKPSYHLGQQALSLTEADPGWIVETDKNTRIAARAVLITAGGGAFGPNRPPLEGIESCEGISVFYMIRRKEDFRNKRVVIAGGGDSAVDWALALHEIAARIAVVHRRDKFRATPDSIRKLHGLADAGTLDLIVPYQLKGLEGSAGQLTGVHVESLEGGAMTIPADVLLPFYGLAATPGPLTGWGLGMEGHHILVDPGTGETNRPGIYAAGDIATYPHKLKLIMTGFAETQQAAHAIYRRLHPDTALHAEYSTTKGLPKI
ncbi:MAG: NAD(P)/FAD-dependent oxidoreductase [Alphaproteobacteria bacterium]|nr:NAD(P)/FAD-dependent oxidoreductase [Alphaproteobacteria bacterium]